MKPNPPSGRRLTEWALLVVDAGRDVGVRSMIDYPDLWADTLDRIARGMDAEEIAAMTCHGMSRSAASKYLRRRGFPTIPQIRRLAALTMYVYHQEHAPTLVVEACERVGVSHPWMHSMCREELGKTLGGLYGSTLAEVVAGWAESQMEAAA